MDRTKLIFEIPPPPGSSEAADALIHVGKNRWVRIGHISAIAPAPPQGYSRGGETASKILIQGEWIYGSHSVDQVLENIEAAVNKASDDESL